ncbi:RHS repeat domain-containing protein [Prevotella jejuni]
MARYDYDEVDNLISAEYERGGEVERLYRVSDRMGNLFETRERDDRRYGAGSRLTEDRDYFYHYDCEGNLVFKEFRTLDWAGVSVPLGVQKAHLEEELGITFRAFGAGWRYDWQSDGMLSRVIRPDGKEVSFAYDALGRRIRKSFAGTTTHFVWDGNIPLHEWTEEAEENVVTWLFEQDTFVPAAKLVANGDCFSIVSDYLGTPMQAYDKQGDKVWEQELDIYGRQRKRPSAFIPFKYQGQYEDAETGLYYNRFRYYDPNAGSYISQDPIGLAGGNPTLYGYAQDTNGWIDPLGLDVFALFEINGKIFEGVNPTQRIPRIESPIPELQHLGYTNSNTFSMHAEIDAMKQAKDLGLRGGKATLMVEGLDICPSCRPAIMDYAKSMGISELEIHELNSGKIYRFEGEEINQVKNGGKSWRAAEVSH